MLTLKIKIRSTSILKLDHFNQNRVVINTWIIFTHVFCLQLQERSKSMSIHKNWVFNFKAIFLTKEPFWGKFSNNSDYRGNKSCFLFFRKLRLKEKSTGLLSSFLCYPISTKARSAVAVFSLSSLLLFLVLYQTFFRPIL